MLFREYVVDVLDFAPNQNILEHSFNSKSLFGSNYITSKALVVSLNCFIDEIFDLNNVS